MSSNLFMSKCFLEFMSQLQQQQCKLILVISQIDKPNKIHLISQDVLFSMSLIQNRGIPRTIGQRNTSGMPSG